MNLNIVKLGKMDYDKALSIQERLLELRQKNEVEDTFLLVEHPPILTLGKRGEYSNILLPVEELKKNGIGIYEINRGGDVTYHGPGQLVGYPIINLNNLGRSVKEYVWNLEEVFIRLLRDKYGIEAHREDNKYTGVWVGDAKITAIGIAVKHWVTMHGFAFNLNTNLEHFKWINPCGITDKGVTSLQKLLGSAVDFAELENTVVDYFCEVFDFRAVTTDIDKLLQGG
jgi:lipoyl(octanoyl) transferase